VKTKTFRINVVELPFTSRSYDLELRYPTYTGLEPQKVEDGGDVAGGPWNRGQGHITFDDE
jgi:hypothetical protein